MYGIMSMKGVDAMRTKFTTTLDPEIIKKLKKQAIDEGLNANELIERYVAEKESEKKGD